MLWSIAVAYADWVVVPGDPTPPTSPCVLEVDPGAGPGGCDAICADGLDLQCGDTTEPCSGTTACVDQCSCTMYLDTDSCAAWGYDPEFPSSIHIYPDLQPPPDCTVNSTDQSVDDFIASCCTVHHEIGHATCYEGLCAEANQENGGEIDCLLSSFDALCGAASPTTAYDCQQTCGHIAKQRLAARRDQCYCAASGDAVTEAECAACDASCGEGPLTDLGLPAQCWAEYGDWYDDFDRGAFCDQLPLGHTCDDYQTGDDVVLVPVDVHP